MSKFPNLAKWTVPMIDNKDHPTALQVLQRSGVSLHNKTVLVTGASSGIGVETVRAFASAGARIFVMVRQVDKTSSILDKIGAEFPQHGGLHILKCDLDSLESVNAAANEFLKQADQLNILVNNAGLLQVPFALTQDGYESIFAVDHMAHHLLFKKLAPLMIKSSTPDCHSRVIAVASAVHLYGDIDFSDINFTQGREFTPSAAYNQAKLANVWFANHLEKLYGAQCLHGMCLSPGTVYTDKVQGMSHEYLVNFGLFTAQGEYACDYIWKTSEQGAATSVWAATSPELEGKGGLYLEDVAVSKPNVLGELSGYSVVTYDDVKAAKLWDWTEAVISKFVKD